MRRARVVSLAVAVVGFAAWTVGRSVEPRQAMFSYLTAYVFVASVVLGALLLLGIGVVSNAAWFVVLRRRVEDFTTAMPVLAVLFVPIAGRPLRALPVGRARENVDRGRACRGYAEAVLPERHGVLGADAPVFRRVDCHRRGPSTRLAAPRSDA